MTCISDTGTHTHLHSQLIIHTILPLPSFPHQSAASAAAPYSRDTHQIAPISWLSITCINSFMLRRFYAAVGTVRAVKRAPTMILASRLLLLAVLAAGSEAATRLPAAGTARPAAIWATTTWTPQQQRRSSSSPARASLQRVGKAKKPLSLWRERAALLTFKQSLSSSDAAKLASWVPDSKDHCDGTWLGVQCLRSRPRRVYMLDLSDQGLLFSLSNLNLTAFSSLQVLWLQGNTITGGLDALSPAASPAAAAAAAAAAGGLNSLLELRVHDAGLTGTIPASLPARLRKLHLQNNQLSGSLPAELPASTPDLEVVLLAANSLQGSVPESWRGFAKLKQLSLDSNANLTGCLPAALAAAAELAAKQMAAVAAAGLVPNTGVCGVCGSALCQASSVLEPGAAAADPSVTVGAAAAGQPQPTLVPDPAVGAAAAGAAPWPATAVAVPAGAELFPAVAGVLPPPSTATAAAAASSAAVPAPPLALTPAAEPLGLPSTAAVQPVAAAAPAAAPAAAATQVADATAAALPSVVPSAAAAVPAAVPLTAQPAATAVVPAPAVPVGAATVTPAASALVPSVAPAIAGAASSAAAAGLPAPVAAQQPASPVALDPALTVIDGKNRKPTYI